MSSQPASVDANETYGANTKVWRYMSFARCAWMLQTKRLWLSRADLLGDPWEVTLTEDQLDYLVKRHPITPVTERRSRENPVDRARRIVKAHRERTFVSCWSAMSDESHALWRIYCPRAEGVSIQTTLGILKQSVPDHCSVRQVKYSTSPVISTPSITDLVTQKLPMFAYEREVRVVMDATDWVGAEVIAEYAEEQSPEPVLGFPVQWDPALSIQSIRVDPEADSSFVSVVSELVMSLATPLALCVSRSDMSKAPPV